MEPSKFYVGIKALIVNDNKFLFFSRLRKNGELFWDIPGGRMNADEDVSNTLKRELEEELIEFKDYKVKELLEVGNMHRDIEGAGLFLSIYLVETTETEFNLSSEGIEYKWLTLEEAQILNNLDKLYLHAINTYISKQK